MVRTVVIDPGHGGKDPGCIYGNFIEKDFNLDMALKVKAGAQDSKLPVAIHLTRCGDEFVTFQERKILARGFSPDFIISIHADSSGDPRVSGMQAYRSAGDHEAHNIGLKITQTYGYDGYYVGANGLLKKKKSLVVIANPVDRPWTKRADYVIKHFRALCPVLLLECGFVTNYADWKRLASDDGRGEIVKAILSGIDAINGAAWNDP